MPLSKTLAGNVGLSRFHLYRPLVDVLEGLTLGSSGSLLALIALLSLGTPSSYASGFNIAPTYPAGTAPRTVAVADFNGDGILDLAVVNDANAIGNGSGVSIMLGNGDGTFQAPQTYAFVHKAYSLVVADFNGDGDPDLAVTGFDLSGHYTVSVLLGKGDGTFRAPQSFVVQSTGTSVAVGDFNGDGIPDLVVAGGYGVSLLLGNGDGTFQAPRLGIPPGWLCMAVGDFNGDGILDLALGRQGQNDSMVSILLGNGDGTFQAPQSYPVSQNPCSVVVGDFNGDGIPDLVVADGGDGDGNRAGLSILLGNGDGTFQPARFIAAGVTPCSLAVGDFNGDGHLDIAMTDVEAVNILLGKGDGTFQVPVLYAAGSASLSVAAGDFNGDGIPDLAAVNGGANTVSILLGKGDGTFQAARSYGSAFPAHLSSIAAGDFNGDGIPDLAVTNLGSGGVNVFLGTGDGSFQLGPTYAFFGPVAVADFNGDGIPDLALVSGVLLGNGDGTFQPRRAIDAGNGPNYLAVGDFNGDGKLDIVTTNSAIVIDPHHPPIIIENGVRVLLGNGDGTFQPGQAIAIQPGLTRPHFVVVGDFNGDGAADFAVANGESGKLTIFLGNGDGTFQPARTIGLAPGIFPQSLAVGDFNGDGILDLAVACVETSPGPGGLFVLLGKGDGTFQKAHKYLVGNNPHSVAVGDFNRDGIPDLAVVDDHSGVSILSGNGDGTFQAPHSYAAGSGGTLVVADFNGDGLPDLALANSVTILLGMP